MWNYAEQCSRGRIDSLFPQFIVAVCIGEGKGWAPGRVQFVQSLATPGSARENGFDRSRDEIPDGNAVGFK